MKNVQVICNACMGQGERWEHVPTPGGLQAVSVKCDGCGGNGWVMVVVSEDPVDYSETIKTVREQMKNDKSCD